MQSKISLVGLIGVLQTVALAVMVIGLFIRILLKNSISEDIFLKMFFCCGWGAGFLIFLTFYIASRICPDVPKGFKWILCVIVLIGGILAGTLFPN
jgi:hypothetical protein